jgi:hypothetical protein
MTILGPHTPYPNGSSDAGTFLAETVPAPEETVPGPSDLDNYSGPTAPATSGVPYPCRTCKTINYPVGQKRWYAVIRGLNVGVFKGW